LGVVFYQEFPFHPFIEIKMTEPEKLQYPIGRFQAPEIYSEALLNEYKNSIATLPKRLEEAVKDLSLLQLETPYREGGWNVREVVHHLADSHMNSLIRFKLTLTEELPVIKPYIEQKWALLADSQLPIEISIQLLSGIHLKLSKLIDSLLPQELNREYYHPQYEKNFKLQEAIALYAWHGNHHLAHITTLKARIGW
jgi:hypothetical protein